MVARTIGRVEEKLDALTKSLATAFVEQSEYTEFAFDRLRSEMIGRFDTVDARFNGVDKQFESVNTRFDRMDGRFDRMEVRFDRLERKLDQFIDTQSRTNSLIERRLQGLEPPPAQQ